MKFRLTGWVTLAVLLLAGVGHAFAPVDQYEFFGPGEETITDRKTGLIWQRRIVPGNFVHFSTAFSACESSDLAGRTNWRLPTVKELLTLIDDQTYAVHEGDELVYRPVDRNAFPNTPPEVFWTSSPGNDAGSDDVWLVNFKDGSTEKRDASQGSSIGYFRCVHND